MARPRSVNPSEKVSFQAEPDVLALLEIHTFDHIRGRAVYGEKSSLINNALRAYLTPRTLPKDETDVPRSN